METPVLELVEKLPNRRASTLAHVEALDIVASGSAEFDTLLDEFLADLDPAERARLAYDWSFWARPSQQVPDGEWFIWFLLAGRGCVAPWTRVFDRSRNEHRRIDEIRESLTVATLEGDRDTDGPPFRKGVADMWTVTNDRGDQITVTAQHRFLTPDGWRRLADVHVGQLLASAPPSQRPEASSRRSAWHVGVRRSTETVEDSPVDCPTCRRSCDPRPRRMRDDDRSGTPSPADVHARSQHGSLPDDRSSSPRCSRACRLSGHHSKSGSSSGGPSRRVAEYPTSPSSYARLRRALRVRPLSLRRIDCRPRVAPLRSDRSGDAASLRRFVASFARSWRARASSHRASLVVARSSEAKRARQRRVASASHRPRSGFSCHPSRCSCMDGSSWSRIVRIEWSHRGEFFDLSVPGGEHYMAEGFVNHNSGKTRSGAETIRRWVESRQVGRISLIAPTAGDARDIMIEGESGIMATANPRWRPVYEPSKRRLTWPNGAVASIFSADKPDRLRGPQAEAVWWDEPASVADGAELLSNIEFGLRLGRPPFPRMMLTGTPKPRPWLRDLVARDDVVITGSSTYENASNLSKSFLDVITGRYAGTRLGMQEIEARFLDDVEGALWSMLSITENRLTSFDRDDPWTSLNTWLVKQADQSNPIVQSRDRGWRTIVAVDPPASTAECGIVCATAPTNPITGVDHAVILRDDSLAGRPEVWGAQVVKTYREMNAEAVFVEDNNGGDMCRSTIHAVDSSVPVEKIHAGDSKQARAEPVATRYSRGHVHHVGEFPKLEQQQCLVAGTMIETDRGPVPIESVTNGDQVMTRLGFAPVEWAGETRKTDDLVRVSHSGGCIIATRWHRIWTQNRGFVPAQNVRAGDLLVTRSEAASTATRSHGAATGMDSWSTGTTAAHTWLGSDANRSFIVRYGRRTTGRYRRGTSSITSTTTPGITRSTIFSACTRQTIDGTMGRMLESDCRALRLQSALRSPETCGATVSRVVSVVGTAIPSLRARTCVLAGARFDAARSDAANSSTRVPVYDIKVSDDHLHEFFANGVLVHNTEWVAGESKSPDRLDALVHAVRVLLPDTVFKPASVVSPVAKKVRGASGQPGRRGRR